MRKRKPAAIGDLLKKAIESLSPKNTLTQEEMALIWQDAVGDKAAAHTKPISFKKASLIINVNDSGWLYELTVKKREILKKLEGRLKGKKLKDIRFRIGEIE